LEGGTNIDADNGPFVLSILYLTLGGFMVLLAIIGLFLPIMPTVPFLLVAAWCFQRSSPRFHHWLNSHKIFGPQLKKWNERGAIGTLPKIWALFGMVIGLSVCFILWSPPLWVMLVLSSCLLVIAAYIVTRPSQ